MRKWLFVFLTVCLASLIVTSPELQTVIARYPNGAAVVLATYVLAMIFMPPPFQFKK